MKTPNKLLGLLLAVTVALTPMAAQAHRDGSEASVLSALSLGVPLAISAAPAAAVLSAGAVLTVASVQVAAAAWGYAYTASCFDPVTLGAFISAHYARGPEDTCAQGAIAWR